MLDAGELVMTPNVFTRRRRIELLLGTLGCERYARRSLLGEIIDLTADDPELECAREAAQCLLRAAELGIIDSSEFARRVQTIEAALRGAGDTAEEITRSRAKPP
jgi:hypothetical protein